MKKKTFKSLLNIYSVLVIVMFVLLLGFDITRVLTYSSGNYQMHLGTSFQPLFIIYLGEFTLLCLNQESMAFMVSRYSNWIEYCVERISRNMIVISIYLVSAAFVLYSTHICNLIEIILFFCYQCFPVFLFILIMIYFEKIGHKEKGWIFILFTICISILFKSDLFYQYNILFGVYNYGVQMQISHLIIYMCLYLGLFGLLVKQKEIL